MDIRVSANPHVYSVAEHRAPSIGHMVGQCKVESVVVDGGLLRVTASRSTPPSHKEILDLLLLTYATLQRKDLA